MARIRKATSLGDWFDQRLAINKFWKVMVAEYWIPKNISFLWAMGVILLALFVLLIISGLMLMCYYKPDTMLAFDSVNKTIMQEVEYGWLWRHMHAIAASVTFLIIYIHTLTGIYYRSYKQGREMIWISGIILMVVFSAEAFSGYMLPWGQMSYWAAQVITQLFGGIPFIGDAVVEWMRGDYAVSDPTLTRFFMLHVCLLPLVVIVALALHFYALRFPHVNNLTGEEIDFDLEAEKYLEGKTKESKVIPFWPGFLAKDFYYVSIFMVFFFYLVGFNFGFAMDPINFDPANSLKTPPHIYPEWYFLWEYEILRGFFFDVGPLKAADIGLIAFAFAMVSLAFIPWLDRSDVVAPAHKNKGFFVWFWVLLVDLILLSIFGKLPADGFTFGIANTYIGFVLSMLYIILILVALPLVTIAERKRG
ncbi:ubiquinol cytochrome c oxidoreductase PetABC, cytochrome b subunit [Campylobacter ureolyticus RIGS 9880]|uniref:Cytochrome bc complex cytochrome b subunit n=2 Tax=Campylobacter ureolyticus TaxID=827 RepID=A0A9Q4KFA5_9BACT|nr:cytochrome bc complex cytochrome b subunit [Campylobacter ureolyticus]AKT91153.1 ubiquinol cytochrome c oxidoreductase PetABC, cytochrome b subunit [Campylobacter ureolyticus RIGS 9880]MCZ6110548.1 cytochrome bc complex cytochrome b subunit [Campylobacter ureolyticus]MCZ6133132.1 cytochrome bc complex cytochrome b subunit [Campylobacter ureolyticus]MCZ6150558.1 cytochrome bc complex cytochrome b subunit [Campylobacter ureolyticus]MCZ6159181.1 cytochrome bc complex cytochrome b subunit [Camp